jgi:hypothetical protein
MYLITFGLLAIALAFRLGPERVRLWREKHRGMPAGKLYSASWRRPQ